MKRERHEENIWYHMQDEKILKIIPMLKEYGIIL